MRITQSMLTNNMLRNLSASYSNLDKYMDQLSTGKKINRPSDDPVVAMKGMNLRSQLFNVEQYERNINEVNNWMDNSDSALDKATQTLHRLRELALQAKNDTYEEGQRKNIAVEVDQLKDHLIEIANTKVNNKFIFNGSGTTGGEDGEKPVYIDGSTGDIIPSTNINPVKIQVSDGATIQVNINPIEVFGDESSNVFKELEAFSQALKDNDMDGLDDALVNLDSRIDDVVSVRSDLGARMNRVELIENRISSREVLATQMMSENEDADIEEVIMNLTTQESIHRAALSAGSRILQPTLLDFLR